jgi:hypothetical protein
MTGRNAPCPSQRHARELEEEDFVYEFGRRPKRRRRKKAYYALRPDAKTLDRYMAKLMGFMSSVIMKPTLCLN